MQVWEIILIGAALSCAAFAAGVSNAAREPLMSKAKAAGIVFTYAFFQFIMPLTGYYGSSAFSALVENVAPYLSFLLLFVLGGKALLDYTKSNGENMRFLQKSSRAGIGAGQILLQGVATSLDALAVGVTLLAQEVTAGLPVHVVLCSLLIGAITLCFSLLSLAVGKAAGEKLQDGAQFLGGAVLIVIGIKILLEGVL